VDRRADVFSTGVLLWETLTGVRLFAGVDVIDTIAKLRDPHVPDPREVAPAVPAEIAGVAMCALSREPDDRFPTAGAMSDALDAASQSSGVATTVKEVGVLVAGLCRDQLERRREAVRDAVRAVTRGGVALPEPHTVAPTTVATTTVADARAPDGVRSVRLRRVAIGGALVAVIGAAVAGLVAFGRSGGEAAPDPVSIAGEPAAAAGSAPAPAPATATATATGSATASAPAPAATAAQPPRPRRSSSPPAPRVKYGNPYGP
jgi:serine/threonine-protein kinase